jgi:hypothetical protein
MNEVGQLVHCQACEAQVAPAKTCRNCGALLRAQQIVAGSEPGLPRLLSISAVDFLTGDEQAFAFLCSLAIRAASGEISPELQGELDIVARDAADDAVLGEVGLAYVKSISNGSPDWYAHLRRLRARLVLDDRVDLLTFAIATTNYDGVDIRSGSGHRRVDAVLDAMHSDDSAVDWQDALENLVIRFAPDNVEREAASWLPLARKAIPAISMGAMLVGHPWVGLALEGAATLAPDHSKTEMHDPASEIELSRQLALSAALIAIMRESKLGTDIELLENVPDLISFMRQATDPSAIVIAEFVHWLKEEGFPIPKQKMQLNGYTLPCARIILESCGFVVQVKARNADGSSASIWQESNWRATGSTTTANTVTIEVRKF